MGEEFWEVMFVDLLAERVGWSWGESVAGLRGSSNEDTD